MGAGEFSENRGDMPWDQLRAERALHDHNEKLLNIRAKYSKVYSKGTRTKLAGSDAEGFLAFNKHYGNQDVVTVINVKAESHSVTLNVPFAPRALVRDEYGGKVYVVKPSGQVTIHVPGMNQGGTVILSTLTKGR